MAVLLWSRCQLTSDQRTAGQCCASLCVFGVAYDSTGNYMLVLESECLLTCQEVSDMMHFCVPVQ